MCRQMHETMQDWALLDACSCFIKKAESEFEYAKVSGLKLKFIYKNSAFIYN